MCDGKAAPHAERFGGDSQPGRSLLPFVFVAVDFVDDIAHHFLGEIGLARDFGDGFVALDVTGEYGIEHAVFRKAVGILLIRTKLGGRRFGKHIFGNRRRQAAL